MGLKPSLSCVTHHLGSTFSRLWSGAQGSQEVVGFATGTLEFENQSLALCQQFSTLVTPNLLQLSHFDSPFNLHRTPASDSVTAPYPWAITAGGIAAGISRMSVVPWGATSTQPDASPEGASQLPPPLPSETFPKKKASGAYHDANQRRFPESSQAMQTIFSRAICLCFSQLSRIIH